MFFNWRFLFSFFSAIFLIHTHYDANTIGKVIDTSDRTRPTMSISDRVTDEEAPSVYLIDSFEDGNISASPKWWIFGNLILSVVNNNPETLEALAPTVSSVWYDKKKLKLRGVTKNWYVGGFGLFCKVDASIYSSIKLLVRGYGENSGILRIELFDDDNYNWIIESHQNAPSKLMYDDRFVYSLPVTWTGWRVVIIPFSDFIDGNPHVGDDMLNPYQFKGSGGLLQIQFLAIGTKKVSDVRIDVDMIKLF